ncbi:MAG: hypothetical protein AAFV29_11705, partial [Myxococcota bacterium]
MTTKNKIIAGTLATAFIAAVITQQLIQNTERPAPQKNHKTPAATASADAAPFSRPSAAGKSKVKSGAAEKIDAHEDSLFEGSAVYAQYLQSTRLPERISDLKAAMRFNLGTVVAGLNLPDEGKTKVSQALEKLFESDRLDRLI